MVEDDGFWFWYDMKEIKKDELKKICKKCPHWKTCKGNLKKCKINPPKKSGLFW